MRFPFDESEIAPELRREQPRKETNSEVPETRPEDVDSPDKTNLDPVDISVDPRGSESTSKSDPLEYCLQRANCSRDSARTGLEVQDISDSEELFNEKQSRKRLEKEREKDNFTDSAFVTGGLQVPVNTTPGVSSNHTDYTLRAGSQRLPIINSPVDIYKYFPLRINDEENSSDEFNPRSISPELEEPSSLGVSSNTSSGDSREVDRELFQGYRRTLEKLTQRFMTKDINMNKFYGYDREDIDEWLDEFDYQLEAREISPDSKTALTQLTIHIAGPAQEYFRALPPEKRATVPAVTKLLFHVEIVNGYNDKQSLNADTRQDNH